MHRKILFNFILLSLICLTAPIASAQIKIPGDTGMRQIPRPGHNSWNPYTDFEAEKERLNLLAKVWKYNPNQDIYLYIYGAEKDDESIAGEFARKAKDYLVLKHNIPLEKITTIEIHQYLSDMEMRMYIYNPDEDDISWFEKLSRLKVGASIRKDFEKAFTILDLKSKEEFSSKNEMHYEIFEGDAFVVYSNEKCSSLPKDTIISIDFKTYLDYLKISDLNFDISQFKTKKDDNSNNRIFTNEDLGITFSISEDTTLISTSFDLSKEQKEKFKCSDLFQS